MKFGVLCLNSIKFPLRLQFDSLRRKTIKENLKRHGIGESMKEDWKIPSWNLNTNLISKVFLLKKKLQLNKSEDSERYKFLGKDRSSAA